MSIPIATSPGRAGFGPQLSLSYDSGAGNGPFGFGWSLSLPQITRKTDKGLPRYNDAEESDVFVLSGAEDLVPLINVDGSRYEDIATEAGYIIHRYRPRIEGLFARIERWTRKSDGDVHWRSLSRDNILSIYGADQSARIADSTELTRIFSWLLCETRDDKGNAVLFAYKPEDGSGVDLTRARERNRGRASDPRRTSNRYLKHIRYGNRIPLLDGAGKRPRFLSAPQIQNAGWMFEVVLDYGEHHPAAPRPGDAAPWLYRADPFSHYRAGFEVRTTRLCHRVLMFHHFEREEGVGNDCLVRSTDFTYSHEQDPSSARNPIYTFLRAVTQRGYRRSGGGYERASLPPVEFEYSQPVVQDTVHELTSASLENLPIGIDGSTFQWVDLHGEGIPGVLTEQAGAWFYKRNLSPISKQPVEFAPLESVAQLPNQTLANGQAQLMDLAGDGQLDLVVLDGPVPGLYAHNEGEGWQPFRPFKERLNRDLSDPNLKFIDLDGDGHADVLISEDSAFVWHPSLAEDGFGPARRVVQALDEENGPHLIFADGSDSIYLADLSGDGLTDLVRIRNGEVCYWPNLGYGRFGAKVSMDNAPWFDHADQFDPRRIRLADIDGSGTTDIIYLHCDGVRLYYNQAGNSWSVPQVLGVFPQVNDLASIVPTDLLGNGTACLVFSSPLPSDVPRPMRYVSLMGGQKPHLLIKTANNLGAETRVEYATSTKFYLQDKRDGKPWITRLPFPVHVVERVTSLDHISRNRFVTRYAYHHGYFDGEEREFRGFGMVEQWDEEQFGSFTPDGSLPVATNVDAASQVPSVLTRTWFHTGIYLGRERVSDFFAGLIDATDPGEYYREPGVPDAQARALLLPDTLLPEGLTLEEEREACRALKGAMLRQEIYALDGTDSEPHPYTVAEQNFGLRLEQPRGRNRHAVFLSRPREALTYHYERCPADPRVQHALTLEVDRYGNVLKEVAVGYGRRQADPDLPLPTDREKQTQTLISYTEKGVTNPIDDAAAHPHDYRTPLPVEARTFELTGIHPEPGSARYSFEQWTRNGFALLRTASEIPYEQTADKVSRQKRLVEHVRTLYRRDDLTGLLSLGVLEPLALPGESYKLAFTPGLLAQVFQRNGQALMPIPAEVLGGPGADRGGYLASQELKADGRFPSADPDDHYWIPSGRVFLSLGSDDSAAQELAYARGHFFLPHRSRDPFHSRAIQTESSLSYDRYDLLMLEAKDALGSRVTVGERLPDGTLDSTKPGNDYRVLQPFRLMDANRNRTQVVFDSLGLVVGTAVMGKPEEQLGDSTEGFVADLAESVVRSHLQDPLANPQAILGRATSRLVYDLFAYLRSKDQPEPQPAVVYALARETHDADLRPGQATQVQHSFSYSDGFGREIQKKLQAEPGPVVAGGASVPSRFVGSGWTVFNNKGKPVQKYEPFFSATHRFEFGIQVGVSPVLFYDPVGRAVATLHPNQTYEKVLFDPWRQTTWDVNDTVLADPRTDADTRGYTAGYFTNQAANPLARPFQTWHAQRKDGALGEAQRSAANKAAAHANTPATVHFDALGRPFLTVAHNRVVCPSHALDGKEDKLCTRVELDIEGNQRAVLDALGRIVMRYDYDLLGNRIHQASMEAGERWTLGDATGHPIRAWDSRGRSFRNEYDPQRRLRSSFFSEGVTAGLEFLTNLIVHGELHPESTACNLRGRPWLHLDQAGIAVIDAYDFRGNTLRTSRRLCLDYQGTIDWTPMSAKFPTEATTALDLVVIESALASRLEADSYQNSTTYDALNRPQTLTTPHLTSMKASVIRPGYGVAGLLERIDVQLCGSSAHGQPEWTSFISNIDYDEKGQRQRIDYGNGTSTSYAYDPRTFRLLQISTRRNAEAFPDDCPPSPASGWPGCHLQSLHYTYDPVGNITSIRDDAQQTIFFRNKRVEPSCEYTYDAIYRLIEATGREHLGQVGGAPIPDSDDAPHVGIEWSKNDGHAMGRYIEKYVYDAVGNFLEMKHRGSDPGHSGWTRRYAYEETSLLENGIDRTPRRVSNRLSYTTLGDSTPITECFTYDAHGSMTHMPHLGGTHPSPNLHWNHADQLWRADLGGGGIAYYVYDASGQRVRKVWVKSAGLVEERVYLSGIEIYRRRQGKDLLERETLHIMDDRQRIALVETRTIDTAGTDPAPRQLTRYQLSNHLGSACIELDDLSQIISYEEYTPYGCTSYQAVRKLTDTPKRYRYTGIERDSEIELCCHSHRYLIPWLGRWLSADPLDLIDGPDLYVYCQNNPLRNTDRSGTRGATEEESARLAELATMETKADKQFLRQTAFGKVWDFFISGTGPARQSAFARANRLSLSAAIERAKENENVYVNSEYGSITIEGESGPIGEVPRFAEYLTESELKMRGELQVFDALVFSPISAVGYTAASIAGADPETRNKIALAGGQIWELVSMSGPTAQVLKRKSEIAPLKKAMNLQSSLEAELLSGKNKALSRQTTISVGIRFDESGRSTIEVSVNKNAAKSVVEELRAKAAAGSFTFIEGTGHAEPNLWNQSGYKKMIIFANNYNCEKCVNSAPSNVYLQDIKLNAKFRVTGNPNIPVAKDSIPVPFTIYTPLPIWQLIVNTQTEPH